MPARLLEEASSSSRRLAGLRPSLTRRARLSDPLAQRRVLQRSFRFEGSPVRPRSDRPANVPSDSHVFVTLSFVLVFRGPDPEKR